MRVVLRREAERELIAAAQYYEACRLGLGAEFLDEAEKAFTVLIPFPARWRVVRADVRRGLFSRFPYAFFYWEKLPGEELEILSISHSKRHPHYWSSRHEA
jgi:plasmid stabilization system protein ParE